MSIKQRLLMTLAIMVGFVGLYCYLTINKQSVLFTSGCIYLVVVTLFINMLGLVMLQEQAGDGIYWMLKIYILGGAVKSIVILCYVYMHHMSNLPSYTGPAVWLQLELIDFLQIVFCAECLEEKRKGFRSGYFIVTLYMLGCALCITINNQDVCFINKILNVLGIGIWYYIIKNEDQLEKIYIGEEMITGSYYFWITLCEYIAVLVIGKQMRTYYFGQYLFTTILSISVVINVYNLSLKKPQNKQFEAMELAKKKIDIQQQRCEKIVSLSHELKTPVNVIRSALTILSMDFKEQQMKEKISGVKYECQCIMNMIQDMIDIQKLKQKLAVLKPKNYNLVEVIENVIEAFSENKYNGRIIFDPSEEEIFTKIDREMCQQCVMLIIGFFLQQSKSEIHIEMNDLEQQQSIEILIQCEGIDRCHKLIDHLDQMIGKDDKQVALELTLQLFLMRLELLGGKVDFVKKSREEMRLVFVKQEEGERIWLEEKEYEHLKEHIQCRYCTE